MPLNDNALVTTAEAQDFLKSAPSDAASLEQRINEASDIIEGPEGCNRPLKAREFATVRIEGPRAARLDLRAPLAWPIDVTKPIVIAVDGIAQTVWRTEADGDPVDFDVTAREDHFFRACGWRGWLGYPYSSNPYNVVLSYTGGYDEIPNDLKLACFYVLQRIFGSDQQKGMTDVASMTSPGGSVSFSGRGFVMPGPAKDILRKFQQGGAGAV